MPYLKSLIKSLIGHCAFLQKHQKYTLALEKFSIKGGSYFAEVGNWPTFMAENGNVA